jgi:hypothetical protein
MSLTLNRLGHHVNKSTHVKRRIYGRLIDRSEKGETRLQMLMVKDLARNTKGNRPVTCNWIRPGLAIRVGLWVWIL